jgi:hypothetical protein
VHPGDDYEATFASAEDVIVKKLQIWAEGGSDRHVRDIAGVRRRGAGALKGFQTSWALHTRGRVEGARVAVGCRLDPNRIPWFRNFGSNYPIF